MFETVNEIVKHSTKPFSIACDCEYDFGLHCVLRGPIKAFSKSKPWIKKDLPKQFTKSKMSSRRKTVKREREVRLNLKACPYSKDNTTLQFCLMACHEECTERSINPRW